MWSSLDWHFVFQIVHIVKKRKYSNTKIQFGTEELVIFGSGFPKKFTFFNRLLYQSCTAWYHTTPWKGHIYLINGQVKYGICSKHKMDQTKFQASVVSCMKQIIGHLKNMEILGRQLHHTVAFAIQGLSHCNQVDKDRRAKPLFAKIRPIHDWEWMGPTHTHAHTHAHHINKTSMTYLACIETVHVRHQVSALQRELSLIPTISPKPQLP